MFAWTRTAKNVISMKPYQDNKVGAALRKVDAYWHGLRHDHPVPARSQVDPRGLEGALEVAFLAERIATGLARLRVAGTHMSDLMGMEVAGMPLSALFKPEARDTLAQALERLFVEPAIIRLDLRGDAGFGRAAITGEMVLYPLRSDMGDVTRALGALVTQGEPGRLPCRMEITGVRIEPLQAVGAPRVDLRPRRGTATPTTATDPSIVPLKHESTDSQPSERPVRDATCHGFAETQAGYAPRPKGKPVLKLVKSDED